MYTIIETNCQLADPKLYAYLAVELQIRFRPTGGSQMTHARTHHRATGILGIAVALALSSISTAPAPARTFNFNSAGSMVQQPMPPQWACAMQRALSPGTPRSRCRDSSVIKASAIGGDVVASQRWAAAVIATGRQQHRATTR